MEDEFNSTITRKTTDDDTHPSPEDRFRYTSQIKSREFIPLDGMVWELFADKNAITAEMNSLLEKAVLAANA